MGNDEQDRKQACPLFYEGLIENDTAKLLRVPKSDIHNHSTKGCRRSWLEERIKRDFPKPPEKFGGLEEMREWFTSFIKPYCSGREGIILRWEGAFAEVRRNNITRLAMNFGVPEIELVGGMAAFMAILEEYRLKYCPDIDFEPEITYVSSCDAKQEADRIDPYIASGFFKSIDVCGGENVQPFEAYLPLYRKAENYHLTKKMHVGESGSAEDVRRAVEVLGLSEVHHGIRAAASDDVMRFLAENRIQLNICPSSNVMLGITADYKDHPIKILYENGVRVTINTDDLLIFDSSIENEYLLLYRAGALTADQLEEIREKGLRTDN
ncbi:MAG: adenosine deaminase [Lachnospiraceae bacterium]|nr:adenosine deaminase [Lachnospiraceae bacterium]